MPAQPDWPRTEPRGSGGSSRRWGSLRGGAGVGIVVGSAALGAAATIAMRAQPGRVLGACIVAGAVIAALAVRPRSGRLIFPVPVLSYLVAALIAGIAYNRSSSKTELVIGGAQWVANGFFAMALATVLAIVLITARWLLGRRRGRVSASKLRGDPADRPPGPAEQGARRRAQPPRDRGRSAERRPRRNGTAQPPTGSPGPDQRNGTYPDQRPAHGNGQYPGQRNGPYPGQGDGRYAGQPPAPRNGQYPGQPPGQRHGQYPDRPAGQQYGQYPDRRNQANPDRRNGTYPDRRNGQYPGQLPGQQYGQDPDRPAGQQYGQYPDRRNGRSSGQSRGPYPDQGYRP